MTDQAALMRLVVPYGLSTFVETGSDTGATAAEAALYFDEVITIEVEHARYLNCVCRFLHAGNVFPIRGDSVEILGRICRDLGPAVYWLDAHANGDARGPVDCPLLDELRHILHWNTVGNVIVIDDLDLFGVEPGYPAVREIEAVVGAYAGDRYRFSVDEVRNWMTAVPR